MYWKYFKYVIEHKKNVGIECLKMGMFIHAITHDLSKFRPSEFFPYAKFFFPNKQRHENDFNFQKAWIHHQKRNKHHWEHWISVPRRNEVIPIEIPQRYVKQMVADWKGMARKFGGSAKKYFDENQNTMIFHPQSIKKIVNLL